MIAPSGKNEGNGRRSRHTRPWIAALCGLAVVSAAVVLAMVARGKKATCEGEGGEPPRSPAAMSPATTAADTADTVDTPPRQPAAESKRTLPPQRPHEVRDGMLMLSNGRLLPTNRLRRVSVQDRRPRFRYAIFDHPTDNELAAILTLKPGQSLVGGPIRHKDYKADFLKSIETPVVVHRDDPEDVREVKRAVIEARMLVKEAIDNGEDPARVVADAYEEARRLSLYRDDIRREVVNMAKEGDYTEEEVDDLIAAANKMLEAKGVEPMALGPIMKARLRTLKR